MTPYRKSLLHLEGVNGGQRTHDSQNGPDDHVPLIGGCLLLRRVCKEMGALEGIR